MSEDYSCPESEDDLISIIQHGVKSSDLIARKLSAMRGHIDPKMLMSIALDEVCSRCC